MESNKKDVLRIGIVGYGNLGRGVELAIRQHPDMELIAIFTRRDPALLDIGPHAHIITEISKFVGKIDVMILCGGSAKDLPEQVLQVGQLFNTVDSFDTHAKIPEYFDRIDLVGKENNTLNLISTGWDPGLFSMARLIGKSILPVGEEYTFWGKGLSQGHSDAVRRVDGVKNGVQYTIPLERALEKVRAGENPQLTTAEKHQRVCYVVAEVDADKVAIENTIKTMPHYFDQYETIVHFISEEDLLAEHSSMPHGGTVFRTGITGNGTKQRIEFNLALEDNPEFTSSVLVAYARAVCKLAAAGQTGACTVFDIPLGYLSPESPAELRRTLL
ncbi:diaminopimelate dehydrogenase [Sphingobacterium sp. SG20118]|uniref:diaminopimelate dehydrogenase n=1 Tax=Sphingobacterium TaxID=28453 RepID=UPI002468B28C|nr:diaminopimelate dehydrogenase [Sphingobacterium faecium]MDH5827150.1 diaminopimelate dehydrogenase [Sphingobacterium faecium]